MKKKDKITAYVPPDLGKKLRLWCASNKYSMSRVLTDALRLYLSTRRKK